MESEKPSYCPQCGSKVTPADRFCGECGSSLDVDLTPPPAAAVPIATLPPQPVTVPSAPKVKPERKRQKRWRKIVPILLLPVALFLAYGALMTLLDPGFVQTFAVSEDGRLLASGGDNDKIMIWRLPERTLLCQVDHKTKINHLAFNQAADLLAVSDDEVGLTVYALNGDSCRKDWSVTDTGMRALGMNGEDVWAVDWQGQLRRWSQDNDRSGEVLDNLTDPNGDSSLSGIAQMAFSPDGQRLALIYYSQYDRIRFYQISQAKEEGQFEVKYCGAAVADISQGGNQEAIAFSCDGDRLVTYNDGEVTLYDAWNHEQISVTRMAHYLGNCPMALDRNDEHAIMGWGNGHIQFFDMTSGQVTATFFHGSAFYRFLQSMRSHDY